ncbi:DUF6892 domain-containing protein [Nocardia lasii]|uniref:DUF6892 domain-containing protein n=1 Tax=Nocardia lasii TaxID=1616107 RepID=A0ABW1JVT5_9NOCA
MTVFVDFNVKLLVIDKLMFGESPSLAPWSLKEAMEASGFTGDLWDHSHTHYFDQVMPDAAAYFGNLDLSADVLAGVEELGVDGGLPIYFECCPHWDGESDMFDVTALDDLALLPNLRRVVVGCEILPRSMWETLRGRGIDVVVLGEREHAE